MTIDDLWTPCPKCQGKGRVAAQGPVTSSCGTNVMMSAGDCSECNGKGGTFTESGEAIAQLIPILKKLGRI